MIPRLMKAPPHENRLMKTLVASWQFWALASAVFAALTAIFAKIGVENVASDLATFVRTIASAVAYRA
jgi:transporter family protein